MRRRPPPLAVGRLPGEVIEVGTGHGPNFPHYPPEVARVAAVCDLLNDTETVYPGTNLVLAYTVKPHPAAA